ncbi:MAG: mechanosensitive ion channel [SAR324 cluster bacterium]|nr:mechanosensitive ion channel [SAR324 cluster bacterium]
MQEISKFTAHIIQIFLDWPYLKIIFALVVLTAIYFLSRKLFQKLLLPSIEKIVVKSEVLWDDHLWEKKAFFSLVNIIPFLVAYGSAGWFPEVESAVKVFIKGLIVLQLTLTINRSVNGFLGFYQTLSVSKKIPIKSYLQLGNMALWGLAVLITASTWLGESPWFFLSGVGAVMAILILAFKDTLLSFIAGIQIATSELVSVGDWIEAPTFKANGYVIDISLHQVIVQNFDKTTVALPVYKLLDGGFKNWRGMTDLNRRRIKRSIFVDQKTIDPVSEELAQALATKNLLFDDNAKAIDLDNAKIGSEQLDVDVSNLHLFRNWLEFLLRSNQKLSNDLTLLVRELDPTAHGLPVEIYAFTLTANWVAFERIQADLLDDILSKISYFNLQVFQISGLPLDAEGARN